jgi:tetratricopeptide (TPR) repeat protein
VSLSTEKPPLTVAQTMVMAWQHFRSGARDNARIISLRVLRIQPKNPDALHLLGILAYQANNQDQAIALLSAAIRGQKKSAPLQGNLALAKLAKGDLNGAAASARKAFALSPSYADAHRVLGLVLERKGRYKEAIREFQRAKGLGLESEDLESHLVKARKQLRASTTPQTA